MQFQKFNGMMPDRRASSRSRLKPRTLDHACFRCVQLTALSYLAKTAPKRLMSSAAGVALALQDNRPIMIRLGSIAANQTWQHSREPDLCGLGLPQHVHTFCRDLHVSLALVLAAVALFGPRALASGLHDV